MHYIISFSFNNTSFIFYKEHIYLGIIIVFVKLNLMHKRKSTNKQDFDSILLYDFGCGISIQFRMIFAQKCPGLRKF